MRTACAPLLALLALIALAGCGGDGSKEVVLYCALDMEHSSLLVQEFTRKTGIRVRPLYDRELTKTVGLVNQIVEEAPRPRCDVFWNNENVNTIKLQERGLLAPYASPVAADLPQQWRDPDGFWTGFAARGRVFIVNTERMPDPGQWPRSVLELGEEKWRGRVVMARPLTGTTLTHFAALFLVLGEEQAEALCRRILEGGVALAPGNAHVMRQVSEGQFDWGFTDTDDFNVARLEGKPVAMVYPDQEGMGTMLIPNTVCLIKGGPNPEGARKLVDFIVSREVEERLAAAKSAQIPLRPGIPAPEHVKRPGDGSHGTFKALEWDPVEVGRRLDELGGRLRKLFAR